eukprot:TRINITY_DN1287_c0_g1_i1.p1 TRINITY_DN1287_c0_g1~~TRINITY_DN1287_c0_g1_i1.p1  ORF type:complete len:168 (-),score=27.63 TRINITY_DN1287_c0_g1_i1:936-1439(-)
MNELVKESKGWKLSSDKLEGDDLIKSGPTLAMICSCIEQLYTLGRRLVDDLDENVTNLDDEGFQFGKIFDEYDHYFYVHIQYASYLPNAVTFLNGKYKKFADLMKERRSSDMTIQQYLDLPLMKITDLDKNLTALLGTIDKQNENYAEISRARTQIHKIYKNATAHR